MRPFRIALLVMLVLIATAFVVWWIRQRNGHLLAEARWLHPADGWIELP